MRIMLFQGSPRRANNCPDQWGKTKLLAEHIMEYAPADVDIDYCEIRRYKGDFDQFIEQKSSEIEIPSYIDNK